MRIVSQDGCYDIPYEQVVIQRFDEEIYFLNENLTGVGVVEDICIAKYSTEEKAMKAMEMLRDAYIGSILTKNVELPENGMEDLVEMMKHGYGCLYIKDRERNAEFMPLNTIWRFPQDDEVEV